ncbi:MAG: phosphate ABC transporter substrate-binding protein PstS family protein [Candidatus Aegiribacteria sp.]|nr:phosphate ABC transporter substrate-binding protein PstS family protein [Candidatus Aegiribacteria sp.]MBD3295138.1 phosphate ABC transporter substrate-binding protein PstS family protein [Candidatus Fermentibacteria bacterium]
MLKNISAALLLPVVLLAWIPSAGAEDIEVAGSTTVQPLAEKLAEAYENINSDVRITVQGGGSSVGVRSAADGTADIGNASRAVKESELTEYPELVIHTIARDGISIVTHPDVPVDGMTIEDVRGIFAGEITNWSEVGGPDQMITVVAREEGSGTRAAFEEMVMDEALIGLDAILLPSNGAVRTTVSTTPNSIGFLSFGYIDSSVNPLAINGVDATLENAGSGLYPVVRPLNMITSGEPSGSVADWLEFIFSDDGQAIVADEGYVPVN